MHMRMCAFCSREWIQKQFLKGAVPTGLITSKQKTLRPCARSPSHLKSFLDPSQHMLFIADTETEQYLKCGGETLLSLPSRCSPSAFSSHLPGLLPLVLEKGFLFLIGLRNSSCHDYPGWKSVVFPPFSPLLCTKHAVHSFMQVSIELNCSYFFFP